MTSAKDVSGRLGGILVSLSHHIQRLILMVGSQSYVARRYLAVAFFDIKVDSRQWS